jgi:hypothetical protein
VRTTLDLDRGLLESAREVLRTETLTETIESALREVIDRARNRGAWADWIGSDLLEWESVDEFLEWRRQNAELEERKRRDRLRYQCDGAAE